MSCDILVLLVDQRCCEKARMVYFALGRMIYGWPRRIGPRLALHYHRLWLTTDIQITGITHACQPLHAVPGGLVPQPGLYDSLCTDFPHIPRSGPCCQVNRSNFRKYFSIVKHGISQTNMPKADGRQQTRTGQARQRSNGRRCDGRDQIIRGEKKMESVLFRSGEQAVHITDGGRGGPRARKIPNKSTTYSITAMRGIFIGSFAMLLPR